MWTCCYILRLGHRSGPEHRHPYPRGLFPEVLPGEEARSRPLWQEFIEAFGWRTGAGYVCHGGGTGQVVCGREVTLGSFT